MWSPKTTRVGSLGEFRDLRFDSVVAPHEGPGSIEISPRRPAHSVEPLALVDPRFRVTHKNGAADFHTQLRKASLRDEIDAWRILEFDVLIGNRLLRQLVNSLHGELFVGKGSPEGRSETEKRPGLGLVTTNMFGSALGGRTPAPTSLKAVTLKPDRARETWSGR